MRSSCPNVHNCIILSLSIEDPVPARDNKTEHSFGLYCITLVVVGRCVAYRKCSGTIGVRRGKGLERNRWRARPVSPVYLIVFLRHKANDCSTARIDSHHTIRSCRCSRVVERRFPEPTITHHRCNNTAFRAPTVAFQYDTSGNYRHDVNGSSNLQLQA